MVDRLDKEQIEQEQQVILNNVASILESDEATRDSDLWLCIQYWRRQGFEIRISYENVEKMAPPESISRLRRVVQNELGKFLPTKPETLLRRRFKEEVLHNYFKDKPHIKEEYEKCKHL